jgi:RimJ/RimL family protein N-acetyltransferase
MEEAVVELIRGAWDVSLIPAIPDTHGQILWKWRNSEDWRRLCTVFKNIVDYEVFIKEMEQAFLYDRHSQYIIRKKGEIAGTIFVYNWSARNKNAFLTVYMDPDFRKSTTGVRAVIILLIDLFEVGHLNKIYVDVYGYNKSMIRFLETLGFDREGLFKKHVLMDGNWYSLHRYAIFQDQQSIMLRKVERVFRVLK